jgi:hypothetical protein
MTNNLKPGDRCLVIAVQNPLWATWVGKAVTLTQVDNGCLRLESRNQTTPWCPHWHVEEADTIAFSWRELMKLDGDGQEITQEQTNVIPA